jgi:hypothetical protein
MKQGQIPDEIETEPDGDAARMLKQIRRVRARGRKAIKRKRK